MASERIPKQSQEEWILCKAAKDPDLGLVQQYLARGINVNTRRDKPKDGIERGMTPLMISCAFQNRDVFDVLLEFPGVDLEAKDASGYNALTWCFNGGHHLGPSVYMVEKLLNKGADPNVVDFTEQNSALMWASQYGVTRAVELLSQKTKESLEERNRRKIDQRNRRRETALMLAAKYGQTPAVEVLLENGADPTLKSRERKTALDLAKQNGMKETAKVLKTYTKAWLRALDATKTTQPNAPSLSESNSAFSVESAPIASPAGTLLLSSLNSGAPLSTPLDLEPGSPAVLVLEPAPWHASLPQCRLEAASSQVRPTFATAPPMQSHHEFLQRLQLEHAEDPERSPVAAALAPALSTSAASKEIPPSHTKCSKLVAGDMPLAHQAAAQLALVPPPLPQGLNHSMLDAQGPSEITSTWSQPSRVPKPSTQSADRPPTCAKSSTTYNPPSALHRMPFVPEGPRIFSLVNPPSITLLQQSQPQQKQDPVAVQITTPDEDAHKAELDATGRPLALRLKFTSPGGIICIGSSQHHTKSSSSPLKLCKTIEKARYNKAAPVLPSVLPSVLQDTNLFEDETSNCEEQGMEP